MRRFLAWLANRPISLKHAQAGLQPYPPLGYKNPFVTGRPNPPQKITKSR